MKIVKSFFTWMASNPDLITLILATLATWLCKVSYNNISAIITQDAAPPVSFFSIDSPIRDLYDGNVLPMYNECMKEDICIVMFYAAWDADSIQAKSQYEQAASLLMSEIPFLAVNCWQPNSNCAKNFNFHRYPVIGVYTQDLNPITYHGPIVTERLVPFLLRIMHPYRVISTHTELLSLRAMYDNVVVGYFNFTLDPSPTAFFQFFAASLRILDSTSINSVVFAVVRKLDSGVGSQFGLERSGNIVVVRAGNTTMVSSQQNLQTCTRIVKFVLVAMRNPLTTPLQPNMVKSLRMDHMLSRGPALILVANKAPQYYSTLLHESAMSYSLSGRYLFESRSLRAHLRRSLQRWSSDTIDWHTTCRAWRRQRQPKSCCASTPTFPGQSPLKLNSPHLTGRPSSSFNTCSLCSPDGVPMHSPHLCGATDSRSSVPRILCNRELHEVTVARKLVRKLFANLGDVKEEGSEAPLPDYHQHADPAIHTSAIRYLDWQCGLLSAHSRSLRYTHDSSLPIWPLSVSPSPLGSLEGVEERLVGLEAAHNRSVYFYTLNPHLYSHLVRNLGLEVMPVGRPAQLLLLDWKNEATYIHPGAVTHQSIAQFLVDFHAGRLRPHLRSQPLAKDTCHTAHSTVCIHTVTADNFQPVVMETSGDVLLLFHAPWCGFCATFMHTYIALARYFTSQKSLLFAKIDVSRNDLPWQFQVERLPSLVLFPKGRKSESSVFYVTSSTGVSELVYFLLERANNDLTLQTANDICGPTCLANNRLALRNQLVKLEEGQLFSRELARYTAGELNVANSDMLRLLGSVFVDAPRDLLLYLTNRRKVKRELGVKLAVLTAVWGRAIRRVDEYVDKLKRATDVLRVLELKGRDDKFPLKRLANVVASWNGNSSGWRRTGF